MDSRDLQLDGPLDLRRTLAVTGLKGPALRATPEGVWRATRTPAGPATLRLSIRDATLRADAWGDGADWVLDRVEAIVGIGDDPGALRPLHPAVEDAARRRRGLRLPSVLTVTEVLIPLVIGQKVTGSGAGRSYRDLIRAHGEPAPGPGPVRLPPDPDRLAGLPYHAFHPLGIERRRAETILRVCRDARRLEAAATLPPGESDRLLQSVSGIGPWTAGRARLVVAGDADAVPTGDYHIPSIVTWSLAGEPQGTDDRMLELLAPYAGQRGRVIRLLESVSHGPPRRGPRLAVRDIRRL